MNTDTQTTTTVILAKDLVKTYGNVHALKGMNLRVDSGEIVAFLGRNGAGKSTTIDIILGLQQADSGSVEVFGMSAKEAIRRGLIGVVLQSGSLPGDYSVAEILKLFSRVYKRTQSIDPLVEETHLRHLLGRKIRKLSGGEQQRVRLAMALIPDPELIILDEPTAGMDVTMRKEFWDLMSTQASKGKTILFATHYLAEAQDYAQRTVIVNAGRVSADAPTEEIRRAHSSTRLAFSIPSSSLEGVRAGLAARAAELGTVWELSDIAEVDSPDSAPAALGDGDLAADQWLRVEFHTTFSDEAVRHIVAIPQAREFEVVFSSLEDVFAELTQ